MGDPIGIDLGTTNSVVAIVKDGRVEVVPDRDGNRLHPSVVGFIPNGDVVVGQYAVDRRHLDPANTIYSAKRLIGQRVNNPLVRMALSTVPYECVEGPNQQPLIVAREREYTVPEISAIVLRYLKGLAEDYSGGEVTDAVITVPANFTDSQRQATKRAGELAGLEVLRVLNEPTAAAFAYGFGQKIDNAKIAVFDLGGGTFDVTALRVHERIFEVLATGGDPFLGGDDFDRTLLEYLASEFRRQHSFDVQDNPESWAKLRSAAEQIKCRLSEEDAVAGYIHELVIDPVNGEMGLDFEITRDDYEKMIEPYILSAVRKCHEVLNAAQLDAAELDDLILVGGSTRTPLVREMVARNFQRDPQTRVNPDETVACGAALQAASLTGASSHPGQVHALLIDVCPRALGIRVAGGFNEIVIEENTPIPVERVRTFSTSKDNQTSVVLQVSQGEEKMFTDNEQLGVLTLSDIEARKRGDSKIEVTFTIDADGILSVRAQDTHTGQETQSSMNVLGAPTSDAEQGALPGQAPAAVADGEVVAE